jgi:hypothetical protein
MNPPQVDAVLLETWAAQLWVSNFPAGDLDLGVDQEVELRSVLLAPSTSVALTRAAVTKAHQKNVTTTATANAMAADMTRAPMILS